MQKTKVSIIGATGYVGAELVRILSAHPYIDIIYLCSKSFEGKLFSDIYPSLRGICDIKLTNSDPVDVAKCSDLVVTALPHGISAKIIPLLLKENIKVLDHSGDFRYRDIEKYQESYGLTHPCPDLSEKAIYGLPEIYREKIKNANLVANPGCYPTCSILGIAPLLSKKIISSKGIIIDAVSGYSGAGRKADLPFAFCETTESFKAYGVINHRHTTEIEQELSFIADENVFVSFTPHLAPIKRGMYATIYADINSDFNTISNSDMVEIYREYYKDEPFVRILPEGKLPQTRYCAGSNFIDITPVIDKKIGKVKIFSCQDNIGKGSSAEAVQSINIMQGYDEKTGLFSQSFGL